MSQRIAQLLSQSEYEVTRLIAKLEDKNGYPSHDARLLAENIQKIRVKLLDLSLDPADTTGEELYHALLCKFQKDSRLVNSYFGVSSQDFDYKSAKAIGLVTSKVDLPQRWSLKKSAAKAILRQNPPRRVMKQLHYRSLESLLKRGDICEIFLAASVIESAAWQKSLDTLVSRLDQTDFEMREVKLLSVSYNIWAKAARPGNYIVTDGIMGTMALWPSEELNQAPLLTLLVLLAEELRAYEGINPMTSIAKVSQIINWWVDMDSLVAELASDHVSLNLKDVAVNSLRQNPYDERNLENGRSNFWRELINRYHNITDIEDVFDNSLKEKMSRLKPKISEPAYEFAEEFDG